MPHFGSLLAAELDIDGKEKRKGKLSAAPESTDWLTHKTDLPFLTDSPTIRFGLYRKLNYLLSRRLRAQG